MATYPLDLVRTRFALEGSRRSVLGCVVGIARHEGPSALYLGLGATLAGVLPFSSIKLATYDLLRRRATNSTDSRSTMLPPMQSAAHGAIAGVMAATTCLPLELVRRRQMAGNYVGLNLFRAIQMIVRDEGAWALMRGNGINTVKVALSNGAGFCLYETCTDLLEVDGRVSARRREPQ